jgi:2-iminobutanoate/2-iminopropanoate deaminase
MGKRALGTTGAPAPSGAYSQAILANGLVFTAGVGPVDARSGEIIGVTIGEQTEHVLTALTAILAEADLDLSDVVKSTVHLQNLDRDFAEFNAVYARHFQQPYPVRTTVGSALDGILVEIDVVAALR